MLPERAEAMSALATGPEEAQQNQEGANETTGATHARSLPPAREPFGLAPGPTTLQVDDLAVAERDHLVALLPLPVVR